MSFKVAVQAKSNVEESKWDICCKEELVGDEEEWVALQINHALIW